MKAPARSIAVGEGVKNFKVGDRVAYVGGLGGYSEARNIAAELSRPSAEILQL